MAGDLISERFNGGADGVGITATNSSISAVSNGTPTFENTDRAPLEGSAWMKTPQTALTSVRWDVTTSHATLYWQHVMYSNADPSASGHAIFNAQEPAATTIRAQIRKQTNGGFGIYNGTSVVASTPAIAADQDVRLRYLMNWGAGTQQLEVFVGANLWGSTPDHTISGALTNATRGRFVLGAVAAASATAGSYHLFDYVDMSSTGFEPAMARTGSLASTLPALTSAVTGTVADPVVTGALAATLPPLAAAVTGSVVVAGPLTATLPALAAATSGSVTVAGTLAATLPTLAVAATGGPVITGPMTVTLPALLGGFTGEVIPPTTGVLAAVLPQPVTVIIPRGAAPVIPIGIPFIIGNSNSDDSHPLAPAIEVELAMPVHPVLSASLPTMNVLLDDGTGTFPHDVTEFVHLPSSLTITRGRGDEFTRVEPSQLGLRFDNVDGRFTLGSTRYGGIHVDKRIRIVEAVGSVRSERFTGYVQDWPAQWPTPTGSYAVAQVTAVDRRPRLARRELRSMLDYEIRKDAPSHYYPLQERKGSKTAGDASGNRSGVLRMRGPNQRVLFGGEGGPAQTQAAAFRFDGQWLHRRDIVRAVSTVEAFLAASPEGNRTFDGEAVITVVHATNRRLELRIFVSRNGVATAVLDWRDQPTLRVTGGPFLFDEAPHHLAATVDGNTLRLYVDGSLAGSARGNASTGNVRTGDLSVGPNRGTRGEPALISHVALYPQPLSAGRIAEHAAAGLTGFSGEPSDRRIGRLAGYGNLAPSEVRLEAGSLRSTGPQSTAGAGLLAAMEDVETAEGGVLFVDGAGILTFHARSHRVRSAAAAPVLDVTSADVGSDLTFSADPQQLMNYITGSRFEGGSQVVADAPSIAVHEQYPGELTGLLVNSDDEVEARMLWMLRQYARPVTRLSTVTLDLLTLPASVQEAALRVELGDRLRVSGLPAQSPVAVADLLIEGWTEERTDQSWSMTFNTVPAEIHRAWILGDPVYGVLDSTTVLSY